MCRILCVPKFHCCLIAKSSPTLLRLHEFLSVGFPRQEYWSGVPFLSPGDLPDPGTQPASLALADGFFTNEPAEKPLSNLVVRLSK